MLDRWVRQGPGRWPEPIVPTADPLCHPGVISEVLLFDLIRHRRTIP